MFDARMRITLAQWLESIVSSVFDQTCFKRLATHFNISMFGHQTTFDGVWSPNVYRLSWTWTNEKCLATTYHQTLFGDQTFYRLDTLLGAV